MQPYGMPARHHRYILYPGGSQGKMVLYLKEPCLLLDLFYIRHHYQQLEDIH